MINKEYLIEVWNSVWEEGLTELEVQKRYFTKLDKKLKGEDRFHLMAIKTKTLGGKMVMGEALPT